MFPVDPFQYGLRFPLGELSFSPNALEAIQGIEVKFAELLFRYQTGAWDDSFKKTNETALRNRTMIVSISTLPTGTSLIIATKGDRSATGVLLLSEVESDVF